MIKTVAIYGAGYVGTAFREYIEGHYDFLQYDPKSDTNPTAAELAACDAAVICVPTPSGPDGACDTSIVEQVIREIPHKYVLIKSTVSPGTTTRLAMETGKHITFSPEFISESTYHNPFYTSMQHTSSIVIGGTPRSRRAWIDFFQTINGPLTKYYQCAANEAELIKYMSNVYSALKVTFVNEMYDVANALGADWHTVREGWLLDERVEPMSTMVFANKRGYGGKCLPKDVLGLINASQSAGYTPKLLQRLHDVNLDFANPEMLKQFIPTHPLEA